MKPLLTLALTLILSGCAADTPSAEEVREHFERGISGGGRLVPIERVSDPALAPDAGFPAPTNP